MSKMCLPPPHLQAERAWHWLMLPGDDGPVPAKWCPRPYPMWFIHGELKTPEWMAAGRFCYVAPCILPEAAHAAP